MCNIIELHLDQKAKLALANFIDSVMERGDFLPSSMSGTRIRQYLAQTLQEQKPPESRDEYQLSQVLLKLLKHENNQLTGAAVELLVRLQRDPR